MKRFLQAVASQCFITGLMQRFLFLQRWDRLPPLYLVLFPIYPRPPIPRNESRGTDGWVDRIVPPPSVGYRLCSPWSLRERSESQSELKCLHGHLHVIASPESHSEFKGSSLEDWGTYLLLEEVFFLLTLTWCSRRIYTRQNDSLQPCKALIDGLLTIKDLSNMHIHPSAPF